MRREDHEAETLKWIWSEIARLLGFPADVTKEQLTAGLDARMEILNEEKKQQVWDLLKDYTVTEHRLATELEDLAPEAKDLKRQSAIRAIAIGIHGE